MFRTVLPIALALIAIVSFSFYEGLYMKDRWSEPGVVAEELGMRFAKVPLDIGEWHGEDMPVAPEIQKGAGAVNYVSRRYTHATTDKVVVLWLIVGHSRDIWRHTPDICYPNAGYRSAGSQLPHHLDLANGDSAKFYTAKFEKEDAFSHTVERVFWTFSHPERGGWEAPEKGPRFEYGLAKALYKLYFTSSVLRDEDTIEESAATDFAKVMLPAIDAALYPEDEDPEDEAEPAATSDEETSGEEAVGNEAVGTVQ